MRPLAVLLAAACCAGAEFPIGDFEVYPEGWVLGLGPEFPGAAGAIAIDRQAPKSGTGALRLDVDFSGGGGYIQVARTWAEGLPVTAFGGWLRSDGISEIRFRIVDAGGQCFQSGYLPLKQGWQKATFAIADLTRAEHWGGANDGHWHGPLKSIALMVPKDHLLAKRTAGGIALDGLTATLEPGAKRPEEPGKAKAVAIDGFDRGNEGWNFIDGREFPGATGKIVFETTGAKSGKGCLRMDADFSGGGSYVATSRDLTSLEYQVQEIGFWVKRSGVEAIGVRLIDSTGQCHQKPNGVSLKAGDGWQEVALQVDEVLGGEHWGGANDGAWHGPLKSISILVGKDKTATKGSLWIDELHGVTVAPGKH